MRSTPFAFVAMLAAVSFTSPLSAQDQCVCQSEFKQIFNGVDLTGWHGMPHFDPRKLEAMPEEQRQKQIATWTEDAKKHWTVENGELVNDGHGAYMTTDREFGDMEMYIDYKTVAKADSGIYLRATPQVQIWDFTKEGGKWKIGADKGSGGLWNNAKGAPGKDPLVLADNDFGQWNRFRILQVGDRTSVWLNCQLVVDRAPMHNFWDRSRPLRAKGPIQLQTHGGEIRWRNVFIREIGTDEGNEILASKGGKDFKSVFNGKNLEGWAGPTKNYNVTHGEIQCLKGKGGTIYVNDELGDFSARMEFKLPPGGNNGLAIRYPGSGDTAYVGMCELQVLDDSAKKYAKLHPAQYHGSAYGMAPAARGYQHPVGEWNFQEVTVNGSRIKVELNGTLILNADLANVEKPMYDLGKFKGRLRKSGYFGFAGHGDAVSFRNISIRNIK